MKSLTYRKFITAGIILLLIGAVIFPLIVGWLSSLLSLLALVYLVNNHVYASFSRILRVNGANRPRNKSYGKMFLFIFLSATLLSVSSHFLQKEGVAKDTAHRLENGNDPSGKRAVILARKSIEKGNWEGAYKILSPAFRRVDLNEKEREMLGEAAFHFGQRAFKTGNYKGAVQAFRCANSVNQKKEQVNRYLQACKIMKNADQVTALIEEISKHYAAKPVDESISLARAAEHKVRDLREMSTLLEKNGNIPLLHQIVHRKIEVIRNRLIQMLRSLGDRYEQAMTPMNGDEVSAAKLKMAQNAKECFELALRHEQKDVQLKKAVARTTTRCSIFQSRINKAEADALFAEARELYTKARGLAQRNDYEQYKVALDSAVQKLREAEQLNEDMARIGEAIEACQKSIQYAEKKIQQANVTSEGTSLSFRAATPDYKVLSVEDTGYPGVVRKSCKVRVTHVLNKMEIERISQHILDKKGIRKSQVVSIYFYLPNSDIAGAYTAGKQYGHPGGKLTKVIRNFLIN